MGCETGDLFLQFTTHQGRCKDSTELVIKIFNSSRGKLGSLWNNNCRENTSLGKRDPSESEIEFKTRQNFSEKLSLYRLARTKTCFWPLQDKTKRTNGWSVGRSAETDKTSIRFNFSNFALTQPSTAYPLRLPLLLDVAC